MQKRLISMVLALSMALTAMPLPALAQSAPPDTASAAALAEENGDVTDIFPDDWSGKPAGDPFGGGKGSWSYDETSNTLTLKDGTFRLRNYGYDSYNNCIQWNVKIEPGATLQEARIGSEYHNGYTVTNAGTISGGTFYGKVICEAGAVISGGTFKGVARVDAAGGEVTIEDGTFEEGSYTSGVTVKAAGTLTINGGTFKGKRTCSVDIDNCEKIVINGGSFESSLTDLKRTTEIIINGGLFNDKLYVAEDKCTVNGGLFTTEDDPLPEGAAVNGGYFTAEHTGLVAIDAASAPVYAPVAVATNGTVTEWSADAYSTLYVAPNTSVTLKPTCKLESVVSGDDKLSYKAKDGAVSFTVGTEAVQFNSVTVEELVIEKNGFPKGTDGGVYGAKGNGWSFEPNHKHAELFTNDVPTLTIEKGAVLDFDKVTNKAGTVKFAVENYGTFSGTLNSTRYVYNREGGVITDAKLNSPQSLYNDGLVKDSVLCFDYIGNGWRDPAQPATIRNSALDVTGYSVVNMASNRAVLDGCYNSAGYTGTAVIGNGGTVKNSKSTLKLPVKNTAGYDGNAEPYQPIIDGGECTVVYNEGGIIQGSPTIHALVAKDTKDLNGAADYYTLNYAAPADAEYAEKYINGINGMMEGVWDAETSTLYVDTDLNTISVITHAPIKSVNGVAYGGSVRYDTERYTSTIDLSKYNIPQTHILNLSATGEGTAELPPANPADFAFVLPNDLTYDGNPKMVDVDVKDNATKDYGAVTVTYKQNGVVLNGAPVEPGDYTFTANVAATATCAGGDVTPKYNTFTIQKAALNSKDFTVTEPTDLTYNGSAKEVTVKNTSDKDYGEITVTYKQNGEALNGAPTEPGEYSYTVTAAGSARYVGGTVKTGSFRITKTGTTDPEPEKTYQLTVAGADITLPEDADASALKAGQLVSLTAYPDTDTVHFAQWVVSGADGALSPADLMDAADEPLTEDAFKQRTLTFKMPAKSLTITAETTTVEQPEQPPEEDSTEYSPLQTVGILAGTTAMFAGCAVIGYEAVTGSILVDLLPKGTAIPSTREQLAVLLWSTAGKPEPTAPAVYSDVAEPDTAKAARWAVEAGLLPDMGEGVFTPGKRVTKVQVIRAWSQLKKLGLAK
ncbi:hypothetical protein CGS59_06985 [Faecalibacterium prausnitzii]|uniref:SLH domain-containing protein n=1 Tax=Faecalibacterium prausnitzii TaxID=853 RepID=A0A2A7AYM2_9FIRM|nr:hypothetical protein [Faecalibacterium prausnitzii]PDX84158.1 hypothetical protein CGS59_06985 [Faecalibacterium prausnitzii]